MRQGGKADMVIKHIKVHVKPGAMDAYLAAQRTWNDHVRGAAGYLGVWCGSDPQSPNVVELFVYWRSRADLDAWMAGDHDRIFALVQPDRFYEKLETRVLDGVLPWEDRP